MDRIRLLILGGVIFAFVATVWLMEQRVVQERNAGRKVARAAEETRTELAKVKAELAQQQAAGQELENKVESLGSEAEQHRAKLATLRNDLQDTAALAAAQDPSTEAAPASDAAAGQPGGLPFASVAKMLEDPAVKKMMRTENLNLLRASYADFVRELGLSATDAAHFHELLADKEWSGVELGMKAMSSDGGTLDVAAAEAAGAEMELKEKEFDARIKGLLGADGFSKFQQYQETLPDREAVQAVEQQFEAGGYPLASEQRTKLLQVLSEERQKLPESIFDPSNTDFVAQAKAFQAEDIIAKTLQDQKDMHRRVADRARGFLSPDQITELAKFLDQQRETEELGIRIGQGFLKGAGVGAAPE